MSLHRDLVVIGRSVKHISTLDGDNLDCALCLCWMFTLFSDNDVICRLGNVTRWYPGTRAALCILDELSAALIGWLSAARRRQLGVWLFIESGRQAVRYWTVDWSSFPRVDAMHAARLCYCWCGARVARFASGRCCCYRYRGRLSARCRSLLRRECVRRWAMWWTVSHCVWWLLGPPTALTATRRGSQAGCYDREDTQAPRCCSAVADDCS